MDVTAAGDKQGIVHGNIVKLPDAEWTTEAKRTTTPWMQQWGEGYLLENRDFHRVIQQLAYLGCQPSILEVVVDQRQPHGQEDLGNRFAILRDRLALQIWETLRAGGGVYAEAEIRANCLPTRFMASNGWMKLCPPLATPHVEDVIHQHTGRRGSRFLSEMIQQPTKDLTYAARDQGDEKLIRELGIISDKICAAWREEAEAYGSAGGYDHAKGR